MVEITGLEADAILYAFDAFYGVDVRGKVNPPDKGPATQYPKEELQSLRDKLFGAHEHPQELGGD